MKNKMPLDGLGLGHDSGSVHCDMLKMLCFRTAWGGREVKIALRTFTQPSPPDSFCHLFTRHGSLAILNSHIMYYFCK